jgi:hypothetical protein
VNYIVYVQMAKKAKMVKTMRKKGKTYMLNWSLHWVAWPERRGHGPLACRRHNQNRPKQRYLMITCHIVRSKNHDMQIFRGIGSKSVWIIANTKCTIKEKGGWAAGGGKIDSTCMANHAPIAPHFTTCWPGQCCHPLSPILKETNTTTRPKKSKQTSNMSLRGLVSQLPSSHEFSIIHDCTCDF